MPSPKNVTVTVNLDLDPLINPTKATVTLTVSENPVPLDHTLHNGIEWEITTPGWSFTTDHHGKSNGIFIKDAGTKFKDKKGGGKKHKWDRDPSTHDGQQYHYTISLTNDTEDSDKQIVVTWDPSIMNN